MDLSQVRALRFGQFTFCSDSEGEKAFNRSRTSIATIQTLSPLLAQQLDGVQVLTARVRDDCATVHTADPSHLQPNPYPILPVLMRGADDQQVLPAAGQ